MKQILAILLVFTFQLDAQAQKPVWDIGTKWTYEMQPQFGTFSYVTNEITDTTTIDGRKLYLVESNPYTGIQYFHYDGDKVYSYNPHFDLLYLLYDFSDDVGFDLNYRPICDPGFDESQAYKEYDVIIDSTETFTMPDLSSKKLQYVTVVDTFKPEGEEPWIVTNNRRVLSHIGFLAGNIHYTHDWELGMYICDEFANWVGQLRCFENDSVSYNFVDYACDSTWFGSSVVDTDLLPPLNLYPNPTTGKVHIENLNGPLIYEVFDVKGLMQQSGSTREKYFELKKPGINIIRIRQGDEWKYHRVINLP